MSPGEQPRDWDKELAEIDRLIAAGPGAGAARAQPAPKAADAAAHRRTDAQMAATAAIGPRARLYTWIRLGLGIALGAAMTQWPYTHGCGVPLFAYLGAAGGVSVAALWSLASSWRTRSAFAHFLSVGLLLWGLVLAAREVLPRVGYAKRSATWMCETAAPPSPGGGRQ